MRACCSDLTDQPFVANYDQAAIADAGTWNGRVYPVNLGRVPYSGMFVNQDLLAEVGVELPTTWSELVAACPAVKDAGNPCMTAGGEDGWPIFVGSYGLLGACIPDQAALVQGLWAGDHRWTTSRGSTCSPGTRSTTEMIEQGASGLADDATPGPLRVRRRRLMPERRLVGPGHRGRPSPEFEWRYIPFPGSDNAEDNQYMFGKYDQGWAIAADSPNKDAAIAYLAEFSEPANYQAFVDAVGPIPTQPTADAGHHRRGARAVSRELPGGLRAVLGQPKGAGPVRQRPRLRHVPAVRRVGRSAAPRRRRPRRTSRLGRRRQPVGAGRSATRTGRRGSANGRPSTPLTAAGCEEDVRSTPSAAGRSCAAACSPVPGLFFTSCWRWVRRWPRRSTPSPTPPASAAAHQLGRARQLQGVPDPGRRVAREPGRAPPHHRVLRRGDDRSVRPGVAPRRAAQQRPAAARRFFRTLFFMPVILGVAVQGLMWKLFLLPLGGPMPTVLERFGIRPSSSGAHRRSRGSSWCRSGPTWASRW